RNAEIVARFLEDHPRVEKVYYLGLLDDSDPEQLAIYRRQYTSPGAMLSFDIRGGAREAFRFLNALKLIKLAVSVGSTESLAEHPASLTRSTVDREYLRRLAISESMARLSVGVEHVADLSDDLRQAVDRI